MCRDPSFLCAAVVRGARCTNGSYVLFTEMVRGGRRRGLARFFGRERGGRLRAVYKTSVRRREVSHRGLRVKARGCPRLAPAVEQQLHGLRGGDHEIWRRQGGRSLDRRLQALHLAAPSAAFLWFTNNGNRSFNHRVHRDHSELPRRRLGARCSALRRHPVYPVCPVVQCRCRCRCFAWRWSAAWRAGINRWNGEYADFADCADRSSSQAALLLVEASRGGPAVGKLVTGERHFGGFQASPRK